MTALIDELRLALQELMQTIGLDGSARTAATVVPLLVLGITLNIVALGVADRVHPMRGKTQLVSVAQANARRVQTVTACVLRRIEGRETRCSAKQWASNRLAERAKCRSAARSGHIAYRFRNGLFFPCSGRSRTIGARETLQAI